MVSLVEREGGWEREGEEERGRGGERKREGEREGWGDLSLFQTCPLTILPHMADGYMDSPCLY